MWLCVVLHGGRCAICWGSFIPCLHPEAHKWLRARAAAVRVPAAVFGAWGVGQAALVARPQAYYVPAERVMYYMM